MHAPGVLRAKLFKNALKSKNFKIFWRWSMCGELRAQRLYQTGFQISGQATLSA